MCRLLPFWDAWLGPGLAGLMGAALLVVSLETFRWQAGRLLAKRVEAHWTERARLAFELRQAALMLATVLAVATAVEAQFWNSGSGCSHESTVAVASVLLAAVLVFRVSGAVDSIYRGSRRAVGERVRSVLTMLLVVRPALLVTLLSLAASDLAPRDGRLWLWVLAVAVLHYAAGAGVTYGLGRALGLVRPARPEVVEVVERARAALPTDVTGIDELAWLMPNALAFPRTRRIAFTHAAATDLDANALYGIALHELGHLHEPPLARWLRPAQSLVLVPLAVVLPFLWSHRTLELMGLFGLSVVLTLVSARLSQRHELRADAHASAHAADYARSLEALYRLAGIPAVTSKRATHPSLYDRMLAAKLAPDYPRPKPPRRFGALGVLVLTPLVLIASELGFGAVRSAVLAVVPAADANYAAVALHGTSDDLRALAAQVYPSQPTLAFGLMARATALDAGAAPRHRRSARAGALGPTP